MATQNTSGTGPDRPGTASGTGGAREKVEAATDEARERAREGMDEARGYAREAQEQAREYARGAAAEARQQASRLADEAQQRARSLIEQQKVTAADAVHGWASALRTTARQLEEQEQGMSGRYAEWAADGIDRISRSLREQDLDALVHQVEDFARRQPALFLGGAVALGFLASRFLKSSAERRGGGYERGHPGREYGAEPDYGAAAGYAPSTGYDPASGTYGPGSAPERSRYPSSAAGHRGGESPPAVGGL